MAVSLDLIKAKIAPTQRKRLSRSVQNLLQNLISFFQRNILGVNSAFEKKKEKKKKGGLQTQWRFQRNERTRDWQSFVETRWIFGFAAVKTSFLTFYVVNLCKYFIEKKPKPALTCDLEQCKLNWILCVCVHVSVSHSSIPGGRSHLIRKQSMVEDVQTDSQCDASQL